MRRVMIEEDREEVRAYHACDRHDCTRVFRDSEGYSDCSQGCFDDSRASARACPVCGAFLYLAEVDRSQKIETWECPQHGCDFSEESSSPSGR